MIPAPHPADYGRNRVLRSPSADSEASSGYGRIALKWLDGVGTRGCPQALRFPVVAGLAEYLEVTPAQAMDQWRSVLDRPPRPPTRGWRQVDFLPVETLLCLAASLVVSHRRFGGSTSHLAPSPVPELARLFRRTSASVLAKMANLDGSRANGARHEVEAAAVLLHSPESLASVYVVLLAAAKAMGVSAAELPDFLGLQHGDRLRLMGQEELARVDVEAVVEPRLRALAGQMGVPEPVTERLLLASVRIGQHRFANEVLANCGRRCVFCGLSPGPELKGKGLLIASHIKPWNVSSERERLDHGNGLAACPSHDAAFDGGLLWVNGGLRIHASEVLASARGRDAALAASFGQPPIKHVLLLPVGSEPPRRRYLEWHRQHVAAA